MSSLGFSLRLWTPQPDTRTSVFRGPLKFNPEVVLQHRLEFPQDLDPTIIHGLILVALNRNYSLAAPTNSEYRSPTAIGRLAAMG